jgi:hypothetical protein
VTLAFYVLAAMAEALISLAGAGIILLGPRGG